MIGPLHFPNNQKSYVFQVGTWYHQTSRMNRDMKMLNLNQVVLKFSLCSRFYFILGNPKEANQSEMKTPLSVIESLKKVVCT